MMQRRMANTGSSYRCSYRLLECGLNCQDFSRMSFLPDRQGNLRVEGKDPRPGLNGPKGKTSQNPGLWILTSVWILEEHL